MSLREKVENNITLVICSLLLAGFLSGIGAYSWVLNISGLEVVKQTTLCPKGQFKLTIDSFPKDTSSRIVNLNTPFFQGICLEPARYEIESSAREFSMLTHFVQIDRADHLAVISLAPISEINLTGTDLKKYSGEVLSLRLNDIEVAAALQLMAEFTNNKFLLNDVSGRVSLSLKNVPWDQALDVILLTNNLTIQKVRPSVYAISGNNMSKDAGSDE